VRNRAGAAACLTPNSLFDAAGYHVTDDTVYYLNAFPGKAFQIDGADVADPRSFPQGRAATGCSETSITFAG
jgi:hypothetical protein